MERKRVDQWDGLKEIHLFEKMDYHLVDEKVCYLVLNLVALLAL